MIVVTIIIIACGEVFVVGMGSTCSAACRTEPTALLPGSPFDYFIVHKATAVSSEKGHPLLKVSLVIRAKGQMTLPSELKSACDRVVTVNLHNQEVISGAA
jgi:hypothetical protein